ncbi:hypothetical protein [Verrucomicrobium spinosum]|uniref:hypothetical protein n=1 Tax=Verrucomicrobium spinosum TaxID=2736 RepID=UPI000174582C|nr:hypothetical protein [Verrucomicrobium spinosum]
MLTQRGGLPVTLFEQRTELSPTRRCTVSGVPSGSGSLSVVVVMVMVMFLPMMTLAIEITATMVVTMVRVVVITTAEQQGGRKGHA